MYFIWRNVKTSNSGVKKYLCKVPTQRQAEWIIDEFIGNPSVAISYQFGKCNVWYGYEYVPMNVPKVKEPEVFTDKYVRDFQKQNALYKRFYKDNFN